MRIRRVWEIQMCDEHIVRWKSRGLPCIVRYQKKRKSVE